MKENLPRKTRKKLEMPPKTNKSKSKKEQRKLETELFKQRKAVLDEASNNADHLSTLVPFRTFKRNGLDLTISFVPVASLPAEDLQKCFDLLKINMEKHYVESLWGWSDKAKMAELKEDTARYLIVRDAAKDNAFAAFCHVRFDWEDDELVLYLYEIQLMPEYRRKGLGKFLMQLCELMARKAKLDALMLTVLGSDTEARAFYDHLKFEELDGPDLMDETDDDKTHSKRYSIMGKRFKPST